MSKNSEKASPGLVIFTERDGQHNGKNLSQSLDTNLNQETSKCDPMQRWLNEEPEKAPWNIVTYYGKQNTNKREEVKSDKA